MITFFTPNYYKKPAPVLFESQKGASLDSVVYSLYNNELIPSRANMQIAAFLFGAERKIKAGRYYIPNGLSYLQLIEIFLEGTPEEQKLVTIPEGIWQHNLARLLNEKIDVNPEEILKLSKDKNFIKSLGLETDNLEGYLLADTYYFYTHSSAQEILRKLKREMDNLFVDSVKIEMELLNMTKNQVLTMASIIEGESNIPGEFKRIAGVYYNRLKRRMRLQADPTIQYLIRERKRFNKILLKDLEIDSPYNTYMHYGLPPAPINNPGKAAVLAAVFPEINNYYYFVADGNGGHKFSRTYSEHQRNVNQYRIWRNSQR